MIVSVEFKRNKEYEC